MRRPFLIGLLAFGTVAGYASGFHHLRYACHHGCDREWGEPRSVELIAPPAAAPIQVVAPAPAAVQPLVIPIVINPGFSGAQAQVQPIIVTLPAQAAGVAPQAVQAVVVPTPAPVAAAPAPAAR